MMMVPFKQSLCLALLALAARLTASPTVLRNAALSQLIFRCRGLKVHHHPNLSQESHEFLSGAAFITINFNAAMTEMLLRIKINESAVCLYGVHAHYI